MIEILDADRMTGHYRIHGYQGSDHAWKGILRLGRHFFKDVFRALGDGAFQAAELFISLPCNQVRFRLQLI